MSRTSPGRYRLSSGGVLADGPREGSFEAAAGLLRLDNAESLFFLASELAALAPKPDQSLSWTILALLFTARQGSTRLPLSAGSPELAEVLEVLGLAEPQRKEVIGFVEGLIAERKGLLPVIGREGDYTPILLVEEPGGWVLSLQRFFVVEQRLVEALRTRRRPEAEVAGAGLQAAVEDTLAGSPVVLSDEQIAAVRAALSGPLTVISGGPGTGKTSIVVSILRALVRLGVQPGEIALAAPTGKAASRLTESVEQGLLGVTSPGPADQLLMATRPAASTLHRLLGYSPGRDQFAYHRKSPLREQVIIVDEGSMVDLVLMERLLGALRPEARLILLGDAEQLPSVEAGAVFRELVAALRGPGAVRLQHNYRTTAGDAAGESILRLATTIRENQAVAAFPVEEITGSIVPEAALSGVKIIGLQEPRGDHPSRQNARVRRTFCERWYERFYDRDDHDRLVRKVYHHDEQGVAEEDRSDLDRLMSDLERARILCLTRSDGWLAGVEALNALLHERAGLRRSGRDSDGPFHPGEPVMVQRNDYARELWNGDQGVVVRVRDPRWRPGTATSAASEGHRFGVAFRRGERFLVVPYEALRGELELCYAMTVHKAQGSEFDHVAVVLPESDLPLLTREIVYTAVTRSRRSVTIVGAPVLLRRACGRTLLRHSGIAKALG